MEGGVWCGVAVSGKGSRNSGLQAGLWLTELEEEGWGECSKCAVVRARRKGQVVRVWPGGWPAHAGGEPVFPARLSTCFDVPPDVLVP